MEKSLSDLLSDALETSFPDLDFENCDGKCEGDETDVSRGNEDKALNQEGTAEAAVLCSIETKDTYMTENVAEDQPDEENDKEDSQKRGEDDTSSDGDSEQDGSISGEDEVDDEDDKATVEKPGRDQPDEENDQEDFQTQEEDDTSSDGDSEQDGSISGEDEVDEEEDTATAVKPGELWMCESFDIEFCSGNKEDVISAEAQQSVAPEDLENTQLRNKEHGENVGIEEESCFGRVPEHSNEMMINTDGIEEGEQERDEDEKEDTPDPVERDENVLAQVEILYEGETGSLEFAAMSVQGLIVDVDSEEYVEKVKEFSGEEHEEAGESFADYPSDFSSCEYVEDVLKNQESHSRSNTAVVTWLGADEDTDEQGDGYLYSRDLDMDADALVSFHVAVGENEGRGTEIVQNVLADAFVDGSDDAGETGEADSDSSTDDEVQARRRDEELLDNDYPQDLENDETPAFSMWSISNDGDMKNNREDSVDFGVDWDLDVSKTASFLSEKLLTTEDADEAETTCSDPCPADDINSYSLVQKGDNKAISPSYRGSLDDSFFFFNRELEISELGTLGNDRPGEKRSWEHEQEIANAFYQFDDDSEGENEREERKTKVHFCTESLSRIIHYEIESSDVDSLSSSTDKEEDLSSADTSEEVEEPDKTAQITPGCDLPNTQPPESSPENDHSDTQICNRKHKCLSVLKLMLKMGVVVAMGLLMFWLATDQPEWLSQASFYKH